MCIRWLTPRLAVWPWSAAPGCAWTSTGSRWRAVPSGWCWAASTGPRQTATEPQKWDLQSESRFTTQIPPPWIDAFWCWLTLQREVNLWREEALPLLSTMCLDARLWQNAVPVPAQEPGFTHQDLNAGALWCVPTCSLSWPSPWGGSWWRPCSRLTCEASSWGARRSQADLEPALLRIPETTAARPRGPRSAGRPDRPHWRHSGGGREKTLGVNERSSFKNRRDFNMWISVGLCKQSPILSAFGQLRHWKSYQKI